MAKFNERKFTKLPSTVIDKRRSTVTLVVNTAGIPNDKDIIAGFIEENTRKVKEEQERREKQEKNPNRKKKVVILGAILLSALLSLQLITDKITTTEHISHPISGMYFMVGDVSRDAWGLVNAVGQEEMTNVRNLTRKQAEERGLFYDATVQARREGDSVAHQNEYTELKEGINYNMLMLSDPNSTQEELIEAIKNLKKISDRVKVITAAKKEIIEESAKGFEKSSSVMKDSRTQDELEVKDKVIEDFEKELCLSEANVNFINDIYARIEAGEEIHFDMVLQALDEDYMITGESSRDVVHETELRGIKAVLNKFSRLFLHEKEETQISEIDSQEEQTQDDSDQR